MEITIGQAEMNNANQYMNAMPINNVSILGSNAGSALHQSMDGTQPGPNQMVTQQIIHGKQPMREESTDNLQLLGLGAQENGGDALPGEHHKVQRTQLTKLKPAGGSTMEVTEPPNVPQEQFEAMMLQEAELQRRESAIKVDDPRMQKKRGLTSKFLTEDEEKQYMVYKMITDLFDFETLKKQPNFAIKKYKDSLYRGQVVDHRREGLGICFYDNTRVYEGSWEKDKRHGKGYERFSNGNQYLGDYEFGRVCGKGLYTWKIGDTYDGEWVDGIKHGYGVWKGVTGDSYIGQWVQNKAHGYGVHEWANGDRYEGEWKYCLRHGQGSDAFANGDVYLGEYNYGRANGYGQYKWANGNTYSGIFKEGMKEGKGVWKKSATQEPTNMYEGEYCQDMKHGQGEFRWASGGFYRGGYQCDIKTGYGEMYWADGSIYRGQWARGIQNGLGIMIFSNGTRKAGIFKENVLVELLIEQATVDMYDEQAGGFPEAFKQELKEYIGLMNPKEDNQKYLEKVLKENKMEDKQMPNTLLEMQEISNAPWQAQGDDPGMTRDQYINFVKEQELIEEQQNLEPPRMEIPTVKEFGVQVSPPTPPHQAAPPQPPQLNTIALEGMLNHESTNYLIDPDERQTPIDYNDPNDHRNYLPPLNLTNNNTSGNLIYHDFDYIGYQRAGMQSGRKLKSTYNSIHDSPKQKSMKSVGTIMSPRAISNKGVARKDNHGGGPHRVLPYHNNNRLPDIVKRGPINKNKNRTIVGLSLQNQPHYDDRRTRQRAPIRGKRTSIENTVRNKPNSVARGQILRAQNAANKFPQPVAPKKPRVQKSAIYRPEYAMPGRNENRQLSVPRHHSSRLHQSSRASISPHNRAKLKPLINQRAWIPGGHPNSIGRNKLASLGKQINLEYQQSVRSFNEHRSHSHGRSHDRMPSKDSVLGRSGYLGQSGRFSRAQFKGH